MTFKLLITTLLIFILNACATHSESAMQATPQQLVLPNREDALGFFSAAHQSIRDTERASYNLMYSIRDGLDSFVYDAQKGYYEDYQK